MLGAAAGMVPTSCGGAGLPAGSAPGMMAVAMSAGGEAAGGVEPGSPHHPSAAVPYPHYTAAAHGGGGGGGRSLAMPQHVMMQAPMSPMSVTCCHS